MRVGFYYEELSSQSRPHLEIAAHLVASVRKTMPDVEVWQLTDGKSPALEGIDGEHRIENVMPMGVRRLSHYSQLDGDWLFVDTDVVIRKDVRDVFDETFDVALTDRIGTYMEGTPYANAMPYNFGVIFSRSRAFWLTALEFLLRMPLPYQNWEGEQRVIAFMMRKDYGYRMKVLPGTIYNFPPLSGAEDLSKAAIVHFKGRAKKYVEAA